MALKVCQTCYSYVHFETRYCTNCGQAITNDARVIQGMNKALNYLPRNDYDNIIIYPEKANLNILIEKNNKIVELYTIENKNIQSIKKIRCFLKISRSRVFIHYLAYEKNTYENKLSLYYQQLNITNNGVDYSDPRKIAEGEFNDVFMLGSEVYKGTNELYYFGFDQEKINILENVSNQVYFYENDIIKPSTYLFYFITNDKNRNLMHKSIDPIINKVQPEEIIDCNVQKIMGQGLTIFYTKSEDGLYKLYKAVGNLFKYDLELTLDSLFFHVVNDWILVENKLINTITKKVLKIPLNRVPYSIKASNNCFYFIYPDKDDYNSDSFYLYKIDTLLLGNCEGNCNIELLMQHKLKYFDFDNSIIISK